MIFNQNTPLGFMRRRPLANDLASQGFVGVDLPGYDTDALLGTAPPQGPHFQGMNLLQGLMAQQAAPQQQAPMEDQSTQASPATVASLDAARQQAAGPSMNDKVMGLLNSPLLQLGVNLLGGKHSLNPWGDALNSTLSAQNQMQAMQQKQQQIDMANKLGMGNLAVNQGQLALGQQNAQNALPLTQAQTGLTNAQTGATTANTQMDQQKLLMAQQQMARQNAIMSLVGQQLGAGLFGQPQQGQTDPSQGQAVPQPDQDQQAAPLQQGQPPPNAGTAPSPNAPTMQPGVFSPSAAGTYGTPSQILDGLMQTESSGNPNAVNPQSGAMGAYQFMPGTVQALANQGMKFDPMNPGQARDAADFYLQKLQQKNGGDWRKTLADYGGFKTKDPSGYIQKVVDNGNAAQSQQGNPPAGPIPAAGPIPVSGPNQGMKMAQLGALAGLAGVPGAAGMVDLGKMMQPQQVQAGGYQYDPNKGTYGFMPDPYKAADTAIKTRHLANETAKTGMELGNNETKRAGQQAADTSEYNATWNGMDRLQKTTQELLTHPGLEKNAGWQGALHLYEVPGSQGKDASVLLENLKSKMLVDTMKDLKQSSSNGASGFGQLSGPEGETLKTYIVNLDRAQSLDQMKAALNQLNDFAASAKDRFTERYNALYGKGGAGVASSIGATPQDNKPPAAAAPAAPAAMSLDDYLKKRAPGQTSLSNREASGRIRH